MLKKSAPKFIRLRGVRHNNLKNFDIDLPIGKLIVITGLSGSGKSSLAFDTLFAEGQRRYIETFSPYARQFFDRMDKPQVDSIEGIPPAIAIEQRNTVRTTRSTVGTMTEICDYAKVIWANLAHLYCRKCGRPVRKEPPQVIWEMLHSGGSNEAGECLVTFDLALSEKLSLEESLALIAKQGYQRLLCRREIIRLDELSAGTLAGCSSVTVIQDRVRLNPQSRSRFVEACEQAYHFGKGKLTVHLLDPCDSKIKIQRSKSFSKGFHCAECDIEYREPSPALFSFNHPLGACPTCRGFGRTITINYDAAIPDRSKTLADGAVKPWQSGQSAECQEDLTQFCKRRKVPMDVPFAELPKHLQDWVIEGDPDYGKDEAHRWPRAWYGVKGYFRWLESKAYKMHVRVLLSRYRSYTRCPECQGTRFQPETLLYRMNVQRPTAAMHDRRNPENQLALPDFYALPLRDALQVTDELVGRHGLKPSDPLSLLLRELHSRLAYLNDVGLGYLSLDRSTRSLSGGETERVNLTTCLGSGLVNTLFVLDEPSVGLHPRDTDRLVRILLRLRDSGNTVVVVEHEPGVIRAADEIVDLGPGHGESGGELVFQGTFAEILKSRHSLTGSYLSGRKSIPILERRHVGKYAGSDGSPVLTLRNASAHNLKDLTVDIPLNRFVCITGVSGSGKTTLIRESLLPALEAKLQQVGKGGPSEDADEPDSERESQRAGLSGWNHVGRVVLVDQSAIGRTPRSNPAVYIEAFEDIRELFARTDLAKQRGLKASAFSFNSGQGQCERCRGAGFEKIEMQFLSDVFIRCPECDGRRYRPHILEIKLNAGSDRSDGWSIADTLDASADEAVSFLKQFAQSRHAIAAIEKLNVLREVGLGYLRLGQPINTLSGGESQRLKLVSHLAESRTHGANGANPTLFLFDEPTTGLHFEDVRILVEAFQRLVNAGHSVVVIEHNLELIKCADWLIDLGPDAGDRGGNIVAVGTPEQVVAVESSHTGQALKPVLDRRMER